MKTWKTFFALVLALSLCLGLFSGCGSSDRGGKKDVYRLSLSFHDSTQAIKTQFVRKWADEVKEATDGRVEITVYASGTLASATDALNAVKQRTCDMAVCFTSFFPGQFPLTEVVSLPMTGITNAEQATNVLWDLWEYSPALREELEDYKVLMLYTNPNNIIGTTTPVYTADDMKGLKLRATSGTPVDLSIAWGATPMTISSAEIALSVEKDVIQGYLIDYTGVNAWDLYEVTDYYTEMPFYVAPWMLLMNQDSWNELPDDLQEIINSLSGRDRSLAFAEVNEREASEARETAVKEHGAIIIEPNEEQLATFQPAADAYVKEWAKKHGTDFFDAADYVNKTLELARQYAD